MDDERTSRERMEQFYRLLAEYGLTGKSQPIINRDRDKRSPTADEENE